MSTPRQLFTGDVWDPEITLKRGHQLTPLPNGTEVKVAVVSTNDNNAEIVLPTVTCDEQHPNADWAGAVIVPEFAATDTANVTDYGSLWFEIQVSIDGKPRTYERVSFTAMKGLIG